MTSFPILDLLLGLVFIYFVLSIISSAIVESILTRRNYRSKVLTRWLLTIFDKQMLPPGGRPVQLGRAIADHCLTTALAGSGRATSFIDAKNFVSALLEKLTYDAEHAGEPPPTTLKELLERIDRAKAIDGSSLLSVELRRTIMMLGAEAQMLASATVSGQEGSAIDPNPKNSFQLFREKLEAWFDSSMDRITGRLKKQYVRPITFFVGVAVAVGLNADTVAISRYLYDHREQSAALAAAAQNAATQIATDSLDKARIAYKLLKETAPAGLPLGWEADIHQIDSGLTTWRTVIRGHLPGWIATIAAIMLGAPFWFDLLNKISNIRGVGNRPASITDKERQLTGTR